MLKNKKLLSFGVETVLFPDLLSHSKKLVVRLTSQREEGKDTRLRKRGLIALQRPQTCSEK